MPKTNFITISKKNTTQIPALHILLIDDDRIQLTLTAAMLAQSGITS